MTNDSTQRPPVFIVGLPRSGTTLLTAMLGAHSRLSCGPETYVFAELTPNAEREIRSVWPDRAVDFLCSIRHGKYSAPENYGITREELADYLRGKDKTLASIASALPELLMTRNGKQRWIEKTPGHIAHTDKIRQHFPNSAIIMICRDPRDVALSLMNVPWGLNTFLGALTYCYELHKNDEFFGRDNRSFIVHYEDLVASPEKKLQEICAFLHEPFEPTMLDTSRTAAQINRADDSWMKKAGEKVDSSRAHIWKNVLTPEQKRQADAIMGNYSDEREALAKTLPIFMRLSGFASAGSPTIDNRGLEVLEKMIRESNVRFWPMHADERPSGTLFIGNPESKELLGYSSKWGRLRNSLVIAGKIVKYRSCGHAYAWPWMADARWDSLGFCSKLIAIALGRKGTLF